MSIMGIEGDLKDEGYPLMMSACEAARAMNCSGSTVHRLSREGQLRKFKRAKTGHATFRRSDVARVIAGG